jgi:hypothetical protein
MALAELIEIVAAETRPLYFAQIPMRGWPEALAKVPAEHDFIAFNEPVERPVHDEQEGCGAWNLIGTFSFPFATCFPMSVPRCIKHIALLARNAKLRTHASARWSALLACPVTPDPPRPGTPKEPIYNITTS